MNKDAGQHPARAMGVFGSTGFTIVAATFAGFLAGFWIDRRLETEPIFMIALLLAGFAGALANLYYRSRQERKDS